MRFFFGDIVVVEGCLIGWDGGSRGKRLTSAADTTMSMFVHGTTSRNMTKIGFNALHPLAEGTVEEEEAWHE